MKQPETIQVVATFTRDAFDEFYKQLEIEAGVEHSERCTNELWSAASSKPVGITHLLHRKDSLRNALLILAADRGMHRMKGGVE